jgi:hypothetical protein
MRLALLNCLFVESMVIMFKGRFVGVTREYEIISLPSPLFQRGDRGGIYVEN